MLDIKRIRKDSEEIKAALRRRGEESCVDELLRLDALKRNQLSDLELLKSEKNKLTKEVGRKRAENVHSDDLISKIRKISEDIGALEQKVGDSDAKMANLVYNIPNIPHKSTPSGGERNLNRFVKQMGEVKHFDFNPLPHWEIGSLLKILDFQMGSKTTGSHFPFYRGLGARLERAIYTFMLDVHVRDHGYVEVIPPFLVRRECMLGTGQLPRMEGDMYFCDKDDLFLIPTAEVPLVNMLREEIIDEEALPLSYVSLTPCFRREAGSYGRETRGLMRVHQFDKVELVRITRPENSYEALEEMLLHAEEVVKRLEIPYRVMELCAEEISFASSKTYDIEVWAPGIKRWLEVSSVSNCEEFQARRAGIRCRKKSGGGIFYPHTLNASGVALARTYLAILENYQQADGTVKVPKVLVPYMGGVEVVK